MVRKVLVVNILATVLLVIIFDVAMFLFLPDRYTFEYEDYRHDRYPDVVGRAAYPKDYFIRHETRGFDIGEQKNGVHRVEGITYPIWSDSLGCFDNQREKLGQYVYFAGDSFTWGYAPFDEKYGSLVHQWTGKPVLKCGVTHTGQRHQYDKLIEIVGKTGVLPEAVFIFYVDNDLANDYAYPHSTVIEGWLVDNTYIDENNELVRQSDELLRQQLDNRLGRYKARDSEKWPDRIKSAALKYSLAANIIKSVADNALESVKNDNNSPSVTGDAESSRNTKTPALRRFYDVPKESEGIYWYRDNPWANNNKSALLDFSRFADSRNIKLVVVLIPRVADGQFDPDWFSELHDYLDENRISYIDLVSKFIEMQKTPDELFWEYDGHFNPSGNRVVAEILIDEFPELFQDGRHGSQELQ